MATILSNPCLPCCRASQSEPIPPSATWSNRSYRSRRQPGASQAPFDGLPDIIGHAPKAAGASNAAPAPPPLPTIRTVTPQVTRQLYTNDGGLGGPLAPPSHAACKPPKTCKANHGFGGMSFFGVGVAPSGIGLVGGGAGTASPFGASTSSRVVASWVSM